MEGIYNHKQGIAWDYLQKYGYLKKRISVGMMHTAIVLHDNTARACSSGGEMQNYDVQSWRDLKEIATCSIGTMGLRYDGQIYYVSRFNDVESPVSYWPNNIKTLANSAGHILGLTEDGKVVSFAETVSGCESDVGDWSDIVEIKATQGLSAGVRKDGTVVVSGNDAIARQVVLWKNIEHVYCGDKNLVVGLQFDGRVVVASTNYEFNTSHWKDIIDISCGKNIIAGIQGNGKVFVSGCEDCLDNIYTINVNNRRFSQNDVLTAFATDHTVWMGDAEMGISPYNNDVDFDMMDAWYGFVQGFVGLKADGHIEINYDEDDKNCASSDWKVFTESFDLSAYAPVSVPEPQIETTSTGAEISTGAENLNDNQTHRTELEKRQKRYMIFGIIGLFLWWPISIYFVYKYIRVSKELNSMK